MYANDQRIKNVFRICYELIDQYRNGVGDQDWDDIHNYHKGKLDSKDQFGVDMYTICVKELYRQYKAQQK